MVHPWWIVFESGSPALFRQELVDRINEDVTVRGWLPATPMPRPQWSWAGVIVAPVLIISSSPKGEPFAYSYSLEVIHLKVSYSPKGFTVGELDIVPLWLWDRNLTRSVCVHCFDAVIHRHPQPHVKVLVASWLSWLLGNSHQSSWEGVLLAPSTMATSAFCWGLMVMHHGW